MKKFLCICSLLITTISFAQSVQEVNDFSKIMLDVDAQVEIVYSSQSKVIMSLPADQIQDVIVTSKNGSLVIKQTTSKEIDNLRIRIYTDQVTGLAVMSDGNVTFRDFNFQKNMTIQSNRGSVINTGDMQIENLNIIRSATSSIVAINAVTTKETVDGVLVALK
jgi:hypothetical protein